MITSLVEPGGARPGDRTRRVVILTMLAYTALAAIFAGAASIGAGLAVLALGMLFTLLIDMRQWRDIVEHDRRNAPPASPRVALPPREKNQAIALSGPVSAKAITSTRLLPYARAQEPVLAAPAEEPAVIVLQAEAETAPAPAPNVQRERKKPTAD